jgi:hypothetical protein
MDQFNYLAVLISIVLGLGITQLLSGFGRWLEQRADFRAYAPSIIWAGVLLVVHVQTWWSMFGLREHKGWTFIQFSAVLMQPILLFLLATLVLPSATAPEQDLRTNYFKQQAWFFGLWGALLVNSLIKDLLLSSELPAPLNMAFHITFFVLSITAMRVKREIFHRVYAYFSAVFICLYIFLLFAELA